MRRPQWFNSERTLPLAECIPDEPRVDLPPKSLLAGKSWMKATRTKQLDPQMTPQFDFFVDQPPQPEPKRDEMKRKNKKRRKDARPTSSFRDLTKKDEILRAFKVRLWPTAEQKKYFQRCFSVAVLAKQLAYKHFGDQSVKIINISKRIQELRKKICTVEIQKREYDDDPQVTAFKNAKRDTQRKQKQAIAISRTLNVKQKKIKVIDDDNSNSKKKENQRRRTFSIVGKESNPCVRPYLRRRLYDPRVYAYVRNNAVVSFCRAVHSTQAFMEERQAEWDVKNERYRRQCAKMELYERQLMVAEDKHFDNLNEKQHDTSGTTNGKKRRRTKTKGCSIEEADLPISSMLLSNRMPRIPMSPGERPQMKKCQVKPPSRNDPTQSFIIDKDCDAGHSVCWNQAKGHMMIMKHKVKLKGSLCACQRQLARLTDRMPDKQPWTERQCTIKYENGRYYAVIVFAIVPQVHNMDNVPMRAVALDPGVRTFNATCDTKGRFGEIGTGQISHMVNMSRRADKIKSYIDRHLLTANQLWKRHIWRPVKKKQTTRKYKKKLKKKRHKARRKVRALNQRARDLKNDAHWRTARVLCDSYDHIIVPKFRSSNAARFLAKSTTRQMLHWSHYQFRQRLLCKAEELGAKVHLVSEPYTSITCSRCLWINEAFRKNKSKWFECPHCGYAIDRDFNGARNILLMNLEKCVGQLVAHAKQ